MRANVKDLRRVLLRQVVMRDVSRRHQSVTVLGQESPCRWCLARSGWPACSLRVPRSGRRAAEAAGTVFVESTVSICPIEEVAAASPRPPWFQLYVMRDRGYAGELMARRGGGRMSRSRPHR